MDTRSPEHYPSPNIHQRGLTVDGTTSFGDGGAGDDTIIIDESVVFKTVLSGGDGDDEISGGSGNDTIEDVVIVAGDNRIITAEFFVQLRVVGVQQQRTPL